MSALSAGRGNITYIKNNRKAIYTAALKTVFVFFVLCTALFNSVFTAAESDMGFNKKISLHTFSECDNENTKAISPVTAMSFPKTQIPSVLTEEKTADNLAADAKLLPYCFFLDEISGGLSYRETGCQAVAPPDHSCCSCKNSGSELKTLFHRHVVTSINSEIQKPCLNLVFAVAARDSDLAAYDISDHYEKFLS